MAYPSLQLVDSSDAVLFDFTDESGAANPNTCKAWVDDDSFNLSSAKQEPNVFEPESLPGGILVSNEDRLTPSTFRVFLSATTYEALRASRNYIESKMRSGGILKWQPSAEAETFYVDFVFAEVAGLFRGQNAAGLKILTNKHESDGLPITIWRQPHYRGAELNSDTNKLRNATLIADVDGDGRPNRWTWDSATNITAESIDSSTEAYKFTIATTGTRNFYQDTRAASAAETDVLTFSFYAKASAGAIARVTPTVQFYNSSGVQQGSDQSGTQTTLTTTEQRLSVTTAAAPANTNYVRVIFRFANAAATSVDVYMRNAQCEEAASASRFIAGTDTLSLDPTGSAYAIVDNFDRTLTDSWGSARKGGAWTVTSGAAGDFDVVPPTGTPAFRWGGTQTHGAANTTKEAINANVQDFDCYGVIAVTAISGAAHEAFVVFRRADANNYYRARFVFPTAGNITVGIEKVVGGVTSAVVAQTSSGVTTSASSSFGIRVYASGTTLRAKLWLVNSNAALTIAEEPGAWTADGTDSAITAAGAFGLRSFIVTAGATGSFYFRDFVVEDLATTHMGRWYPMVLHGDASTPVKVKVKANEDSVAAVLIAARSNEGTTGTNYVADAINELRFFEADTATLTNSTSAIHDQEAFNRAAAIYQPPTQSGGFTPMEKRIRIEETGAAALRAARGDWDVWIRWRQKSTSATLATFLGTGFARWGASLANPSPNAGAEISHDTTSYSTARAQFPYVEQTLCRIRVPESGTLAGIAWELWTRLSSAENNADGMVIDGFVFVPTDAQSRIIIATPGVSTAPGAYFSATSGGGVDGTTVVLDTNTDTVDYTFGVISAGLWRVTISYSLDSATGTPNMAVRAGSTTVIDRQLGTGGATRRARSLEFLADGTSSYSVRVTGPTAGSVTVIEAQHAPVPVVDEGEHLLSDPTNIEERTVSKFDSSNQFILDRIPVDGSTPLFVNTPGFLGVYVLPLDSPHLGVMSENASTIERTIDFSYSYSPRWL